MAFGTFTLKINLGNDAMGDADDVADALGQVQAKLRSGDVAGRIRDVNGNTVGQFDLDLDEEDEGAV